MQFARLTFWCVSVILALVGSRPILAADGVVVLDDCSDAARWEAVTSDGVQLKYSVEPAADPSREHGTSLRLDFEFASSGFAGVRRRLPLDLPPNFEISFSLRGVLPRNHIEFKLVDESGENVWWVNRRSVEFPREWANFASRRRHFTYAWGPKRDPLTKAGSIEFVVASAEGGRGTVWIDDFTFRELPITKPYASTPTAAASSQANEKTSAAAAIDGDVRTVWRSATSDSQPTLTIDFNQLRDFGGLVVDWEPLAFAGSYDIEFSDDGSTWTKARQVTGKAGRPQFISLPDAEARAVRLVMTRGATGPDVAVREVEVLPWDASRDENAFMKAIADRVPRGRYPRATTGEGIFWTIVGVPIDEYEALVSEDGAVEVDKQAFSLEPFLISNGNLLTWADAKITQSLADGFAPVPTVTREHDGLKLTVTAAADGDPGQSSLTLLYTVTNNSNSSRAGKFVLAVRPFQVNPPYQWLNAMGGISRIERIEMADSRRQLQVDDRTVALGAVPDEFGATTYYEGDVSDYLAEGRLPPRQRVIDPEKRASGALEYKFQLAAGASQTWAFVVPFSQIAAEQKKLLEPFASASDPVANVRERQAAVVGQWKKLTDTFDLLVPAEATDIVNTIRSTLAYILVNQDGLAIHPGSRSYERSWIRDGSLTSAALCRFGMEKQAMEFVDWYGPFQFESGKVPCVVDGRGADPVPENDSHGEYVMAVMNVYRFTGDKDFLQRHWPRVQKAVAYIEKLRGERMTAKYADPNTTAVKQELNKPPVSLHAFYGLMPESISHEGYAAKPMHSYWDDSFTLRGLKDAADMARAMNEPETAEKYQQLADDFGRTLVASIELATKTHGIDYIPGCVEFGDFDATSTTVALWPGGARNILPADLLNNTFNRYWDRFVERRDDPSFEWIDYTPYELRVLGSFVLLGQPERAHEALAFFMNDRRPQGWNQWPEVIHREPRTAKFIGDLPHTWCGSDFVNSIRTMFLYERDPDDALVLLAGIPGDWVSEEPVGFRNMPTYGGRVTCTLARPAGAVDKLVAHVDGTCPLPAGKVLLSVPGGRAASATVNGAGAEIDDEGRVIIQEMPAEIEVTVMPKTGR
jgi:hypothetical protein